MRSDRALRLRAAYLERPGLWAVAHQPTLRRVFAWQSWVTLKCAKGVTVTDTSVHGHPTLKVRATGADADAPRLMYLHGGGFVIGSPRTHLGLITHLAKATGFDIWAPSYPLAPEHPAPAAWDAVRDLYDALQPDAVAGDSAGGNLSLHLAMTRRPTAAALLSPVVDLSRLSQADFSTEVLIPPVWPRRIDQALQPKDATDPTISPIFGDLSKLPPTLVQAARNEVLEDDAHRLSQASDAVTLSLYDGVPHVWQMHAGQNATADRALAEIATFLKTHVR